MDFADKDDSLQNMLTTCDTDSGYCGVQWVNDYCVVQTYFSDQVFPTNCPDSPCPYGDTTCAAFGDDWDCGDTC